MQQMDRGRSGRLTRRWPSLVVAVVVLVGTAAVATAASAGHRQRAETIKVGLITKDVTNPFFVKMRAGATAQAKKLGAELIYAAGKNSSDNAGQITAIENMVTAGVKGILITVADAKARERRDRQGEEGRCARDRARLSDESDVGRRRALRDEQLQRRRPDREVRQGSDEGSRP